MKNNIPEDFDWKFYLEFHTDLKKAGFKTEKDAKQHYLNHGIDENRVYKKIISNKIENIKLVESQNFNILNLKKENSQNLKKNKLAFTVSTFDRLGMAKSLADSLTKKNPDYHFVIILIGENKNNIDLGYEILEFKKILGWDRVDPKKTYPIAEYCYAFKPYGFLHFFNNLNYEIISYFDSDIFVFDELSEIDEMLKEYDILLTPHITKISNENNNFSNTPLISAGELSALSTGLFNLGYISIKKTENSIKFLEWWSEKLNYFCIDDKCRGLFTDQKWVDLSLIFFKKIGIIYNEGYNVAPWNIYQRKISKNENYFLINDFYKLKFLHYSGYEFDGVFSKHINLPIESDPIIFEIFTEIVKNVYRNGHKSFFK